jgi:hypothetical protein
MIRTRSLKTGVRRLACVLVFTTTLVCSLQTGGYAMLAPAAVPPPAADGVTDRAADVRTVQKTLESKVLRQRLHELGLSDKEIQTRLDKLSDQQVHQLASRINAVNPGGDFTLFGLLLLVVLVLLIIYLVKRV